MNISGNKHIFTLSDAVKLINAASGKQGLTPKALQKDSALLGNYSLTDEQALIELDRLKSGKHGLDNPNGVGLGSIAGGKLPGHPTFSNESPYAIKGLKAAEAGNWTRFGEDKWNYSPSQAQFDRDPEYLNKLMQYFEREKGKGINSITMPDGSVVR